MGLRAAFAAPSRCTFGHHRGPSSFLVDPHPPPITTPMHGRMRAHVCACAYVAGRTWLGLEARSTANAGQRLQARAARQAQAAARLHAARRAQHAAHLRIEPRHGRACHLSSHHARTPDARDASPPRTTRCRGVHPRSGYPRRLRTASSFLLMTLRYRSLGCSQRVSQQELEPPLAKARRARLAALAE